MSKVFAFSIWPVVNNWLLPNDKNPDMKENRNEQRISWGDKFNTVVNAVPIVSAIAVRLAKLTRFENLKITYQIALRNAPLHLVDAKMQAETPT